MPEKILPPARGSAPNETPTLDSVEAVVYHNVYL
jgi:hypothetical protein